jgi:alkanesulfonate monooxygenase SsuD/methylene tetrahydromethanopterin reductase-like flavin-dependent oxidoreductase (luciferase family)
LTVVLTLRFDMRVPDWAGSAAAHYSAVLDMCEWAETRGAALSVLSEHHGADDGHLPTPLILASAVAARTQEMAILLAAVPLPLWDPVRLAEEISVLDLISRGRVRTRSVWATARRSTPTSASTWLLAASSPTSISGC